MALSYVGGTSGGGTGASYTVSLNGTLTGGTNSSPSAGDLIIVLTGEANGASVTSTCSGNTVGAYSTIRAHQNQADTHDANLDSFYTFAGATPDTTLTITRGANNTTYGSATVVHVWRGADSTNPFNVTPTIAASANGSAANPAAITPTTAGSVVLYCGHASQLAASGTAYTTAGTYPISRKFDGSTGDSIVMASHYTAWTSGAYDPAAFAGSTTATTLGWVALTVVIKPFVAVTHATTGVITGPDSAIVGSAAHIATHASTAVLLAGDAKVVGAASRSIPSPIIQEAYNVDDSGGSSTTIAATLTGVTAGNALVVFVGYGGTGVSVTVSDGTSYTESASGECADTGSDQSSRVFYLPNVSSGSHTITATFGTTRSYRRIRVFEVSGLASSSIEDKSADQYQLAIPNTIDAVSSSATETTTQADCVVLGLTQNTSEANPGTGTLVAGTGYTLIGANQILGAEFKVVSATGTQTATFTPSVNGLSRTTHVIAFKKVSGPVTHATTGALTGSSSSLAGTAAHIAIHGTTGVLTGSGSSSSGSAARFRAHATTGVLSAAGGSVVGTAARSTGAVTHATTGALVGANSTLVGSASRFRVHVDTGAITGAGSSVSGSAARFRAHATTGVLAASGAVVAGAASRFRAHATTGTLIGERAVVVGSARHNIPHASTGSLVAQDTSMAGSANRSAGAVTHVTTGTLTSDGSSVSGSSNRFRSHGTTGTLTGAWSYVSGTSTRFHVFSSTGTLFGSGSALSGSANRTRVHTSTGELVGDSTPVSGSAQRNASHTTAGVLLAEGASVVGTASRAGTPVAHDTTGALSSSESFVIGLSSDSAGQSGVRRLSNSFWKPQQVKLSREVIERIQSEALAADSKAKIAPIPTPAPQPAEPVAPRKTSVEAVQAQAPRKAYRPITPQQDDPWDKILTDITQGYLHSTKSRVQYQRIRDTAQATLDDESEIELLLMYH